MSNKYFVEVVQGDPRTIGILFKDADSNPQDLTGWEFAAHFKENFADTNTAFELNWGDGVDFKDGDPTTGIVLLKVEAAHTQAVNVSSYTPDQHQTPFKEIVGDVKITPPVGVDLEIVNETRPMIYMKVYMGITND